MRAFVLSKIHLCLFFLVLTVVACQKENKQFLADIDLIQDYISTNNIPALEDEEARYFYDLYYLSGDSLRPKRDIGLSVEVNYTASLLDGTIIHDTNGSSVIVELDNAIFGWQLALPRMAIGDKMRLLLPSRLAYADEGNNLVPPNSVLIFDIDLVEIHPHF